MEVDVAVPIDLETEDADTTSGHHRAASRVLALSALTAMGMSTFSPSPTVTLPHQANPFVGSSIGPAPSVFVKGYGCWPERIIWA